MIIKDHRLLNVPFRQTPNMSGTIVPEYLVIHYTATQNGPATIAALCSERLRASAHLVVDLDGSVTQLVPFDRKAWHAGKSEWKSRSGLNGFSIGIEIVNPGPLKVQDSGFADVYGRPWSGDVFRGKHKNGGPYEYWARYTDAQLNIVRDIGAALFATYGLQDVLGHDDISPGRKIDPGPAFPLDELRSDLLHPEPERAVIIRSNDTIQAVLPLKTSAQVRWDDEAETLTIQDNE